MIKKMFFVVLVITFLQACSFSTQATSGKAYLDKYDMAQSSTPNEGTGLSMEEQIRQAASVEPVLKFPARIGLARIEEGDLSVIPGSEVEAWEKAKEKMGSNFGEFVPVNPMVANMVASSSPSAGQPSRIADVTNKIRLGAARQHLDAVLVYEVYSKENNDASALSIGDLTIIGAFILPSRQLEVKGFGSGLLIDVVQGYPYGTIETSITKEEFHATVGSSQKTRKMADQITTQVVQQLAGESVQMFNKLRVELAEKRADRN